MAIGIGVFVFIQGFVLGSVITLLWIGKPLNDLKDSYLKATKNANDIMAKYEHRMLERFRQM